MGYDTLYRERAHLVGLLSKQYPSEYCDDPEDAGWRIVYVHLGTGQVSWHIAPADWDLFGHVAKSGYSAGKLWDGHDTEEKYRRLDELKEFV